ncbi:hypothetical protein CFP56_042033 [Quercus suber]|uniref:Uncharacterized protein n=1 Tax=Quercus suber TaxID=58331 RepID=A0AAW0IUC3_QUESU
MIHDGVVVAVELSRVVAGAPQLITIGAVETGGNNKDSHYLYICPLAFALALISKDTLDSRSRCANTTNRGGRGGADRYVGCGGSSQLFGCH